MNTPACAPAAYQRAPKPPGIWHWITAPYLGSTGMVCTPWRIIYFKMSRAARFMATSVLYAWRNVCFVRPTTSGCLVRARPAWVRLPALKGASALRKSAVGGQTICNPPVETTAPPSAQGYTRAPHRLPGYAHGHHAMEAAPQNGIPRRLRRSARPGYAVHTVTGMGGFSTDVIGTISVIDGV
jgi:hypothetical protein